MYTNTTAPNFIICKETESMEMLVQGYPFMLAFSSDTLVIIDKSKMEAAEWIIVGQDDNGYVLQAAHQDEFLDTILAIKQAILSGDNPIALFVPGA